MNTEHLPENLHNQGGVSPAQLVIYSIVKLLSTWVTPSATCFCLLGVKLLE